MPFISSKILLTIFSTCLFMIFITTVHQNSLIAMNNRERKLKITEKKQNSRKLFIVDTPGCQIPNLDPFDPEVRKFYSYTGNKVCPDVDVFATANRTHLNIDMKRAREKHGNDVSCGYKRIWREGNDTTDQEYGIEDSYNVMIDSIPISDEFIMVGCEVNKTVVYRDFFPSIQLKPRVEEERNLNFNHWMDETGTTIVERLSVTIIGVDSVSRLNMLRHMPKTFAYLRDVMDAIDLQGFTKVADNTFVNVVPMLSGLFVEECWNESLSSEPFDNLDLVWKEFANKGFRTLFAEDYPEISIFDYLKAGFFHQPTDYYLRPFTIAASNLMNTSENCYNNRLEVDVVLQWLRDFLEEFRRKPTFAFVFNTRLTHEDLNDAGYADEPYLNFLTQYYESHLIDNSVLIFFSDHGMRFGDIRETFAGKIEERMPFYFIIFPPWFPSKYPDIWANLQTNQNRLTTPFDVYATLKDILNFTGEVKEASLNDRGISLFSEIPQERTCEHAAILPHWCTCEDRSTANLSDIVVINTAQKLVRAINAKVAGHSQCAVLELDTITNALISGLDDKLLKFQESVNDVVNRTILFGDRVNGVFTYLITVLVKPSQGMFEGTVQYTESTGIYLVSDEISRINRYGEQPCVQNAMLRKFCYCK